jgi:hypothetical protein
MKTLSLFKAAGALLALATVVQADPLTWSYETTTQPLKFLSGTGSSSYFTGEFDLTPAGFNPATMTISSATAYFAFADDKPDGSSYPDPDEYVDIFINNLLLINDQEVDGAHPSSSFAWYSQSLNANMIIALQDDGKVSYKVQLLDTYGTNDTYLKIAKLVAQGSLNEPPPPVTVPDAGSTSALVGLAFAALLAFRRRFQQAA